MAFEGYIKFDGIDGESPDKAHAGWIRMLSFTHGITQTGGHKSSGVTGGTGGEALFSEFSITKAMDKASAILSLFCSNGESIPKAVIELVSAKGDKKHVYMKWEFQELVIASISVSGADGGDDRPTESVSFRFKSIKWIYTPFKGNDAGEAIERGWNVEEGVKL